jgi:hypothetical protein
MKKETLSLSDLSHDQLRGFAAGVAGKKPTGQHSEEWIASFEVGCEFRRGHADGCANRLLSGAQSRAWEAGYNSGQAERRKSSLK